MDTNTPNPPAGLPTDLSGNYNPVTVTVNDAAGVMFLGVIALALLAGLLRSEARHRALLTQLAAQR